MSFLPERVLEHLASVAQEPDLSGTRYRLIGPLGRGGMGAVYAVEDTLLGREVALKVTTAHVERLRREATVIAGLEHPGIVPVHDLGELPDGSTYYVMKRVRGERLDRWLAAGRPVREVLRQFQRVCEAVAFAHAHGVIHRDLKPENIMVGPLGEALVMDWGLAKAVGAPADAAPPEPDALAVPAPSETAVGAALGTPAYMSPEQARGENTSLSARSDVYALGATLYFLLAGRPPFDGESAREVIAKVLSGVPAPLDVPRPLVSICSRAMAKEPASRFPTAKELSEDVARFLDGLPPRSHRETVLERLGRFVSRNKVLLSLLLAYLVGRLLLLTLAR